MVRVDKRRCQLLERERIGGADFVRDRDEPQPGGAIGSNSVTLGRLAPNAKGFFILSVPRGVHLSTRPASAAMVATVR